MKIEMNYKTYFLLSAIFLSNQLYANVYVNGMAGVATGKTDEAGNLLGRIGGGYHVTDNVDVGANWSYIGIDDENKLSSDPNLHTFETYGRINTSLNTKSKFYLDAGIRDDVDNFMAGIGILYSLTNNLELDIGYRHYNSPNNQLQGDVYAFGIGLQYNFGVSKINRLTANQKVDDINNISIVNNVAASVPNNEPMKNDSNIETGSKLSETKRPPVSDPYYSRCKVVIQSEDVSISDNADKFINYTVKNKDWLLQIGRDNCITLDAIIKINPWLEKRRRNKFIIHPGEQLLLPKVD